MTSMFGMTPKGLAKALNLPRGDPRITAMFEVHHHPYWPSDGILIQGIYGILDTVDDGWTYVGSSRDCHRRKKRHDYLLRTHQHHCLLLQDMCARIDDARWRFIVLEEVEYTSELTIHETWWRYNVTHCIDLEDRRTRWELEPLLRASGA